MEVIAIAKSITRSIFIKITLLALCSGIIPLRCNASWLQLGTAGLGSIVAYKMLFGSKATQKTPTISYVDSVNQGLNIATKIGILAGAFLIFDRLFLNNKLATQLSNAKKEITEHVTSKIDRLKKYIEQRFNKTDKKIDRLENTIAKIKEDTQIIKATTKETNRLVKKGKD